MSYDVKQFEADMLSKINPLSTNMIFGLRTFIELNKWCDRKVNIQFVLDTDNKIILTNQLVNYEDSYFILSKYKEKATQMANSLDLYQDKNLKKIYEFFINSIEIFMLKNNWKYLYTNYMHVDNYTWTLIDRINSDINYTFNYINLNHIIEGKIDIRINKLLYGNKISLDIETTFSNQKRTFQIFDLYSSDPDYNITYGNLYQNIIQKIKELENIQLTTNDDKTREFCKLLIFKINEFIDINSIIILESDYYINQTILEKQAHDYQRYYSIYATELIMTNDEKKYDDLAMQAIHITIEWAKNYKKIDKLGWIKCMQLGEINYLISQKELQKKQDDISKKALMQVCKWIKNYKLSPDYQKEIEYYQEQIDDY